MRKFILSAVAICSMSMLAPAQSMLDAIKFGTNNYYGTARSMAMGNAMTAVGGDMGSVGINPAGGSVAGYTQVTFSPGLDIACGRASYAPSYSDRPSFGPERNSSVAEFILPDIGALFVLNTENTSGIRSFSIGVLANNTSVYNEYTTAYGNDINSSLTGSRAYWATHNADGSGHMLPANSLSNLSNAFSNYYWNYVCAYDGGLINYSRDNNDYFGSAERASSGGYGVGGRVNQNMTTRVRGTKNDLVFNFAFNMDNCFYFGFNLGLPMMKYNSSETLVETADVINDFPVKPSYVNAKGNYIEAAVPTYYKGSTYKYSYSASMSGIYGKFGVIWLPNNSIRLGAAIQTPTAYRITQSYGVSNSSTFLDSSYNGNSYCDSDLESYRFRSPFEANFGAAVTFGGAGMLSVDYELTDFSVMKYSDLDRMSPVSSVYSDVNILNAYFCGLSHSLRIGAEINLHPAFSVRAGYNLITDPERTYNVGGTEITGANYQYWRDQYPTRESLGTPKYDSAKNVNSFSAGIGYKSPGSFFADLGVRYTMYPKRVYSLYSTYLYDSFGDVRYYAPEESLSRRLWDVVLTLGWRF